MTTPTHSEIVRSVYDIALEMVASERTEIEGLEDDEKEILDEILRKSESGKGVLTVIITSLVHKLVNPQQDIRNHQDSMENGYSGRGVDVRYITPFMKEVKFPAMAESGWLTRSLEQNIPYTMTYPGRITPITLKTAFLNVLNNIQCQDKSPRNYLLYLFIGLIIRRDAMNIELAKPTNLSISTIIDYLVQHFNARYTSHGASRLPTIAIYSAYQCMMSEVRRFDGKVLMPLESHTSADAQSGRIGDIEIRLVNNRVFEGVEVKHGIKITPQLIRDAYEKFSTHPTQRYYLLSTVGYDETLKDEIFAEVNRIATLHGCQVIPNGLIDSIKYYLRLLENTYEFIDRYVENVKADDSIKFEHKEMWNRIVTGGTQS